MLKLIECKTNGKAGKIKPKQTGAPKKCAFITFIILLLLNGWMDELGFYAPSTVFQSFRDDGRVNTKGSVQ